MTNVLFTSVLVGFVLKWNLTFFVLSLFNLSHFEHAMRHSEVV